MRPSRSRRRRRLTSAINATSGVVALGSLLVVIELGAPAASNLGLGLALPSVGHGGTPSQPLADPNFPTLGSSATSVVETTSPAPVVPAPAGNQVVASAVPAVTSTITAVASGVPSSTAVVASAPVLSSAATPTSSADSQRAFALAAVSAPSHTTGGGPQGQGGPHGNSAQAGVNQQANGAGHGNGNQQGQGGDRQQGGGHGGSD